jgi:hypothetical protein
MRAAAGGATPTRCGSDYATCCTMVGHRLARVAPPFTSFTPPSIDTGQIEAYNKVSFAIDSSALLMEWFFLFYFSLPNNFISDAETVLVTYLAKYKTSYDKKNPTIIRMPLDFLILLYFILVSFLWFLFPRLPLILSQQPACRRPSHGVNLASKQDGPKVRDEVRKKNYYF